MDFDAERKKQEDTEIRQAFREIFPLANELDLPWAACNIKQFLRNCIEDEAADRIHHYQSRIVRVLCEVAPPKTHVEDMCRIVVEEAKRARNDRKKLEKAVELNAERDEMLVRLREIGKAVGCNHYTDPDGRIKLVQCVRETWETCDEAVKILRSLLSRNAIHHAACMEVENWIRENAPGILPRSAG